MKLATLRDGTRDGQLMVVARDLKTAHLADAIAPTLQAALDDWAFIAPQLDALAADLNAGRAARAFAFDPAECMAPLPRAYQWIDNAADPVQSEADVPSLHAGGSDAFLGAADDIVLAREEWGIDFSAKVAAITGDVPVGATPDQALAQIRLITFVNDVVLRNVMSDELGRGAGQVQSKPATAFAPVTVTPDELGDAWRHAKVCLPLRTNWNGVLIGQPHMGEATLFNFAQLVAYLCKTRRACAGTIVSMGALGKDKKRGHASIAEIRNQEVLASAASLTEYLRFGDKIYIDMLDSKGKSICGPISQTLKRRA